MPAAMLDTQLPHIFNGFLSSGWVEENVACTFVNGQSKYKSAGMKGSYYGENMHKHTVFIVQVIP